MVIEHTIYYWLIINGNTTHYIHVPYRRLFLHHKTINLEIFCGLNFCTRVILHVQS